MTKILSIILLIGVIGGGIYFSKNYMKEKVTEGTPIAYGQDKKEGKNEKKSFTVTFPKADSILAQGEKVNIRWNSLSLNLNLKYPVTVVNVDDTAKKPIEIGTAKYSLFNRLFVWNIPLDFTPGNYKIVFGGPKGGESSVFKIVTATPTTLVNNPGPAVFSKVSSNISTVKNNNVDMGVNVRFILNIQANGSDIYASGTSAVVVLKDVATGKVLTEKTVTASSLEPGLIFYQDGNTRPFAIETTFPISLFPAGGNNVKASIYSINYTTFGTSVKPSTTYTALDFSLYDTGVITIYKETSSSTTGLFTRNLGVGDIGADVLQLKQILATKGFGPLSTGDVFDENTKVALAKYQLSVNISPADGYFGPMTRATLNAGL